MTNRQRLTKSCDDLWSKTIKLKAKGLCQIIGCKKSGAHAHHIARRGGAVRWLPENGIYLCAFHHNHDKETWMNWAIMGVVGITKFEELEALSRQTYQHKEYEIEEVKVSLKQELKRIKT